jgi:hypothetical protein
MVTARRPHVSPFSDTEFIAESLCPGLIVNAVYVAAEDRYIPELRIRFATRPWLSGA